MGFVESVLRSCEGMIVLDDKVGVELTVCARKIWAPKRMLRSRLKKKFQVVIALN